MTRPGGVTDTAADAAIDTACRALRLPTIRDRFPEIADAATRGQLSYRGSSPSSCSRNATTATADGVTAESRTPDFPATNASPMSTPPPTRTSHRRCSPH
jgi:hypothetical protein